MNDKIICFVMHGRNCKNRYNNVMNTWGKDIKSVFYSDYEDQEKNILKSTDRNDYFGLEEKIVSGIKLLFEHYPTYEWYFLCDDDTFVNTEKLMLELENFEKNKIYGRILVHYLPNESVYFLSGGGGTLISNENMKRIYDNLVNYGLGIADVSLGLTIKRLGIQIENSSFFLADVPESQGIKKNDYKNYITFHNIKDMSKMSEIYNTIKL